MPPAGGGWHSPTRSLSVARSLLVAASGRLALAADFFGDMRMDADLVALRGSLPRGSRFAMRWDGSPAALAACLVAAAVRSVEPALSAGGASRLRAFPGARIESGLAEESSASSFSRGLLMLDLANGRDAAEPAVGFRLIGFAQLSDASLLLRS